VSPLHFLVFIDSGDCLKYFWDESGSVTFFEMMNAKTYVTVTACDGLSHFSQVFELFSTSVP
jgi:hypothetical protein